MLGLVIIKIAILPSSPFLPILLSSNVSSTVIFSISAILKGAKRDEAVIIIVDIILGEDADTLKCFHCLTPILSGSFLSQTSNIFDNLELPSLSGSANLISSNTVLKFLSLSS